MLPDDGVGLKNNDDEHDDSYDCDDDVLPGCLVKK
jgi:hypothetical protein